MGIFIDGVGLEPNNIKAYTPITVTHWKQPSIIDVRILRLTEIKINNLEQITATLNELARRAKDKSDLMRQIAGTMHSAVDLNFADGGRPKWLGLSYRQGDPLRLNGGLQDSIESHSDNNRAVVGTNKAYAAIHQFGGVITPKKGKYLVFKIGDSWIMTDKVEIPARPFLTLPPQDEADILQDIQDYFQRVLD